MHTFRWDLDKTYLATDFDSMTGLVRTALQSAEDKENIPGTAALMRELGSPPPDQSHRIEVISGSPRQMRGVLERKFALDGVQVDRLTLKPNLSNLLRLRLRAVRDQIGYKLPALLESRVQLGADGRETCFGDDAEMDGLVYCLYTDICSGRVAGPALDLVLGAARLYPDQANRIRVAAGRLTPHDPVERILIHLEGGTPTARFEPLGTRVSPTFNTFQTALVLWSDGHLELDAIGRVVEEMRVGHGYTSARLQHSLEDAVRRGLVDDDRAAAVAHRLKLAAACGPGHVPSATSDPVDYVRLLHTWRLVSHAGSRRQRLRDLLGSEDD